MPPRRSTRAATRLSVEPSDPPTAKRKRVSTSEPKSTAPTSRRSSARLSVGLEEDKKPRSTRGREKPSKALEEVPESDEEQEQEEEEEEERPKPKKARPSLEPEEDDEDAEEEEDEEEEEEQPKPKQRSTRRSVSAKPASRGKRASVDKEPTSARGSKKVSSRSTRNTPASTLPKVEEAPQEPVEDDEMATDTEDASKAPPVSTKPSIQDVEDEEEHSLLDHKPPTLSARRALGSQKSFVQANAPEQETIKSRLVINKLALVNFKSYAGRQEIGPFHKSFSSIVGPNGSGKSNTIDALLFVFGYRASKMRQAKLSELIHHSAKYPDLDFCSVEVHFQDIIDKEGDDYEVVPGTKLTVTRHAYRNNSNRYSINGATATYKEVQTLLKGRGIDLDHNRFLILQGEVESIAQMKPKAANEGESDGLLEYLEDIIGTSSLLPDITASHEALEAITEERQTKLNRVRHVEKEKLKLEKEKREAEDFLRLRNSHTEVLNELYQLQIYQAKQHEKVLKQKEADLLEELERLRADNEADLQHLESLETHYEEQQIAYKQVAQAVEAAQKELKKQETFSVGIEERKKHESAKNKKLKKTVQDDQKALDIATRAITENQARLEKATRELAEHEERLKEEELELAKVRDSLKDKTQVFHDQIEAVQKKLQPCQEVVNRQQAKIDVLTVERDDLIKKKAEAEEKVATAEGELDMLQNQHAQKIENLERLGQERAGLHQKLKGDQEDLKRVQALVEDLKSKASSSRQRVTEAAANQAQQTTQNKVGSALAQLQRQGRVTGFHGRLGSLGTIPDEYDVAITTACSALNNMVVDTVEQAQICIEYLRAHNVGRASFVVLEKLPKQSLQRIQTPEGSQRLFDLITPAETKFAPAFFKAIGNTLVTTNMDQANRIAYHTTNPTTKAGKWRVVTTAGQLIDSSGTMSGGGNHVARGGMSAKLARDAVAPEVLDEWQKESEKTTRDLDEARMRHQDATAEIERLRRSIPELDTNIEKAKMEVETGKKRIMDAQKRLKELKAQSKPSQRESDAVDELQAQIDDLIEQLEGDTEKAKTFQDQIDKLQQQIIKVGGAKLLMQKDKVDGTKLHINLANDEITKAEVAKAKAEKDTSKLEESVQVNAEKLVTSDSELEKVLAELQETVEYIRELQGRVDEAQEAADTSKEILDKLQEELDEKNEEVKEFRKKETEIQRKVDGMKKDKEKFAQEIHSWQVKLESLSLDEVDDEEDGDDEERPEQPQQVKAPSVDSVKLEGDNIKPEPDDDASKLGEGKELVQYEDSHLKRADYRQLMAKATFLREKIDRSNPNLSVLAEYRKREEEFLNRAADLEKTTAARDAEKAKYDALRKQRLDEFMQGFTTISLKLKEMYQMITLGGNAELELVDSMDPFSEGIIFSVMPPKKSWKNISNLSGGEKTLSSLALVFALHVYKPTPLYFMDEIDAALDFRNVSIVANYIKDRTKNAQFIIISLRNDMFELSHRLIGIYKTANATKSISVDNNVLMSSKLQSVARTLTAPISSQI